MSTSVDMMRPLPDVIEPRWWMGSPALSPASFTVDCSAYAMDESDLDPEGRLARKTAWSTWSTHDSPISR
jgi:hypothetical protein